MRSGRVIVDKVTVHGAELDVHLHGGIFSANYDGVDYEAPTLEGLTKRLRGATKVKVAIAFTKLSRSSWNENNPKIEHGVAVGRHSGNRNLLIRWADNPKRVEQGERYGGSMMRPLTEPEGAEWLALVAAEKKAEETREAWEEAHEFDLGKAVDAAIREGLGGSEPEAVTKRRRRS